MSSTKKRAGDKNSAAQQSNKKLTLAAKSKTNNNTNWIQVYIKHTKHFKLLMSTLSELLDDVIMDFRPDGFNLQSMDSSHIGMGHVFLAKKFFSQDHPYLVRQATSISVNIKAFVKILNVAHDTDTICLYTENATADEMNIHFVSATRTSKWKMALRDFEDDKMQVPVVEYGWVVRMQAAEFQRLIKELSIINEDDIKISLTPNSCTFDVVGTIASGTIECKNSDPVSPLLSMQGGDEKEMDDDDDDGNSANATSTQIIFNSDFAFNEQNEPISDISLRFSMRYLNIFSKTRSLAPFVNFHFRSDSPLLVKYDLDYICSGGNNNDDDNDEFGFASENEKPYDDELMDESDRRTCWLAFYLAPKFDDSDQ